MNIHILRQELDRILSAWAEQAVDKKYGGFYGLLDGGNQIHQQADKSFVLNAQILRCYSLAYQQLKNRRYLTLAKRSFLYIKNHFLDTVYGGVYWSVDYMGNTLDTNKHLGAQAAAIYGLSAYFGASKDIEALEMAKDIFLNIEKYGFDIVDGGYKEVLDQEWKTTPESQLKEDVQEKRTLDTHLNIVEAYADLYSCWPDPDLKKQIKALLKVFLHRIIQTPNHHVGLVFDESWQIKSARISLGHNMEASWLLLKAAEVINEQDLIKKMKKVAVSLCEAVNMGLNNDDGSLSGEYDPVQNYWNREKQAWVQAEAMVGFYNAWQISLSPAFYQDFEKVWQYIDQHNHQPEERLRGRTDQNEIIQEADGTEIWEYTYHYARACLELMKRMSEKSA